MSILLDAVTRNKQQSSPLPDAVLTPRANYPQPRRAGIPVAKLGLLALAIAVGVGGAWGVSMLHQANKPSIAHSEVIVEAPASVIRNTAQEPVVGSGAATTVTPAASTEDVNTSGIRLAGKVALPRAQELNDGALVQQTLPNVNNYGRVSNISPNDDPSYEDYLTTSAAVGATTSNLTQSSITDEGGINQAAFDQTSVDQEPIMLGAGANRQGLKQLDALRQQVNAAAADVGLETEQSRQDDKLVATFQDALKDVEYTKAAKTPVTEPKLDPIPKLAGDNIPKYGQLPAELQLQVPEFNIVAHVYSTNESQRWLNVDGAELQEGDMIGGKLKIISIRPRDVVLEIRGTQFKVPAM